MISIKDLILKPVFRENPITIQVLGICSALAVTSKIKTSLVMGLSVIVVLAFSNLFVSIIRKKIPGKIRIIIEMIIISSFVILIDQFLKAFAFQLSKELSIFIGLIITNCIVLGRLEAFAIGNKPFHSFLDGIGNGIGYALILILVGFFRELLGSGSIFDHKVFPASFYNSGYMDNGLLVLAPGAFFILSIIVWIQKTILKKSS